MPDERPDTDVNPPTAEGGAEARPVRAVMRNYFSSYLLWSAKDFAGLADAIEKRCGDGPRFDIEHRARVIAAVMAAVGFLEAMVNELFQDAADEHGTDGDGYIAPLTPRAREFMQESWLESRLGFEPVLNKYQLLLVFAERPKLDPGAQPYQDAAQLVLLRNAVVHYKPESVAADVDHRFTRSLRGKFPDNALMAGSGNAWWPDHALGAGCAQWGFRGAKAFADTVSNDLGISPNYMRHEASWFRHER